MIKASFLPLLYSQKLFGTQGLFKSRGFESIGVPTQTQNQQELGFQKRRILTNKGINKRKNLVNTETHSSTKARASQKKETASTRT